ncbi:hypothetical protein DASC09_000310 [Saccharomycopsis crataegensis]|uniref:F-box domain-containing protein n=1 Tax=Saccharomycopsis crataegensis TaxID=43959 RepID=A0AAV5QD62_9ASCO|nr:hypothetical protein DASC09_000310 [Saccharomycopsis crataegensis]
MMMHGSVLLDLPPEVWLNILKHLDYQDWELVGSSAYYFRELIRCNQRYLFHLRVKDAVKPALSRKLFYSSTPFNDIGASQEYLLISGKDRMEILGRSPFIQQIMMTKVPGIYKESVFNNVVSQQLILTRFFQNRNLKLRLSFHLMNRPSKKQLVERGILKYGNGVSGTIHVLIGVLKKNSIEDMLRNFVKSYRYHNNLWRRQEKGGNDIQMIIKRLNNSNGQCEQTHRSIGKVDEDVLRSIKIQNKRLMFERMT